MSYIDAGFDTFVEKRVGFIGDDSQTTGLNNYISSTNITQQINSTPDGSIDSSKVVTVEAPKETISFNAGENLTAGNALRLFNNAAYKASLFANNPFPNGRAEAIRASNASHHKIIPLNDNKVVSLVVDSGADYVYAIDMTLQNAALGSAESNNVLANSDAKYDICKVANDKVALVFSEITAADGQIKIISYSGTTPTGGTPVDFETGTQTTASNYAICSPTTDVAVVAFNEGDDSQQVNVIACTISGTTPTFGVGVAIATPTTVGNFLGIAEVNTNQFVTVYYNAADMRSKVGTLSGSTITIETAEDSPGVTGIIRNLIYLSSGKVLLVTSATTNNAVIGTVSGTGATASTSWGTPFTLGNLFNATSFLSVARLADNVVIFSVTTGLGDNQVAYYIATVSGGTMVYYKLLSTNTFNIPAPIAFDSSGRTGVQRVAPIGNGGLAYMPMSTTNAYILGGQMGKFIGYANNTATLGNAVVVDTQKNSSQSGLVAGSMYYLSAAGAIATEGNEYAGTALSSTEILVDF